MAWAPVNADQAFCSWWTAIPGCRRSRAATSANRQGRDALQGDSEALYLTKDPRGMSLEELAPEAFAELQASMPALMRAKLREEMQVEFVVQDGALHILDGVRVVRVIASGGAYCGAAGGMTRSSPAKRR